MSERMRRVNESVRQVLAEAIGELKDPRIGLVTLTGVETSPDLRQARVFVSVLGSERKRERTLERARGGARRAPGAARAGAQDEAHPSTDLRIRSERRARRPHVAADR